MNNTRSYIHTYSAQLYKANKKINYEEAIFKLSNTALISLISGLQNTNFGLDTLTRVIQQIQNIKKRFLNNKELFIDSGGYSIIAGDVHPHNLTKFINCYNAYLESERETFDHIFSLDIPILLKYPDYNTKKIIYDFNKRSLTESIKVIDKYPELKNKFVYVWQFKLHSQYKIWNDLYNELEIDKYSYKQAIGGMVGLIGKCQLTFSPFIVMCFKCLKNYELNKNKDKKDFFLHLLGVYHRGSRFILYLIKDLFSHYLKQDARITFDTINYFLTSQYKARDNFEVYNFQEDNLIKYNSFFDVPTDFIRKTYQSDILIDDFKINLNCIKQKKKLTDVNFASPLYLQSQLNYDKFLKFLIKKYNFIELILEAENSKHFLNLINCTLFTIKHEYKLTTDFITLTKVNLKIIYNLHCWYKNGMDENKLETYISQFINKINFPFDLS